MFPDTSKNAYFLVFFQIFEIQEKKKGLPSNFQRGKSCIFVPFRSLFGYFRHSNVIVSTIVLLRTKVSMSDFKSNIIENIDFTFTIA